jgi:hypothetical protein
MAALPKDLELSCLPQFVGENGRQSEIYLAYHDKATLEYWCGYFKRELDTLEIVYHLL